MPTNSEFSDVRFADKSNSAERQQGNLGVSGEHGYDRMPDSFKAGPVDAGDYPNVRNYGYDPGNPQFYSKMTGDPISLSESTRPYVEAHGNLNEAYGLLQPVATIGTHPWLRDGLVTPDELEPGNAEPRQGVKMPNRMNGK
jgi:hypothetical protein